MEPLPPPPPPAPAPPPPPPPQAPPTPSVMWGPLPCGSWRGAGQSPSVRGPRPAGQRQLVAAAWDATSGGGGGALPTLALSGAAVGDVVGSPRHDPACGRARTCLWLGAKQQASPVPLVIDAGLIAKGSAVRFLFATRKEKKFPPLYHQSMRHRSSLLRLSHSSRVYSSVLPICPPNHLPSTIHFSFHPFMHQPTH